uniref:Uncharacterized protein n=1 Tax=viral metagenome TaxID=1070528 RepID=A0A6M3XF32_9ZZZZ
MLSRTHCGHIYSATTDECFFDEEEWVYKFGEQDGPSGMIEFVCVNCGRAIYTVPLDDCDSGLVDELLDKLSDVYRKEDS